MLIFYSAPTLKRYASFHVAARRQIAIPKISTKTKRHQTRTKSTPSKRKATSSMVRSKSQVVTRSATKRTRAPVVRGNRKSATKNLFGDATPTKKGRGVARHQSCVAAMETTTTNKSKRNKKTPATPKGQCYATFQLISVTYSFTFGGFEIFQPLPPFSFPHYAFKFSSGPNSTYVVDKFVVLQVSV